MKIKQIIIEAKYDQVYPEKPDFKMYRPQANDKFHHRLYTFFEPEGENEYLSFVKKGNPAHRDIYKAQQQGEISYEEYQRLNIPRHVFTGAIDQVFNVKKDYVAFEPSSHSNQWWQRIIGVILRHKNNKVTSMAAIKDTGGKIRPFTKENFLELKIYKDVDV